MIVTSTALKNQQEQYLEAAKKEPVHIENTEVLLLSEQEYQEKMDFFNTVLSLVKNGEVVDATVLNQFLPPKLIVAGKLKPTAEELTAIAEKSEENLLKMTEQDFYDFVEK
jgi:hypothetical protein